MSVGEEVEKRENKCIPVFLAELFTIAKIWKQSKFTSTDKKMEMCHTHTHTHTHTLEYYSATNKSEILPFTTWMDLEDIIMVSEISQTKKD